MNLQDLEPYLRMAISNIRTAEGYVQRMPGKPASLDAAVHDLDRAIAHIVKYAEKKQINLRDSMHT